MKKVLLFLFFPLAIFAQNKIFNAPIGVQAYTYRKHFPVDVEKTLDIIQKEGITELEGSVPKNYTAESFLASCNKRGINVVSTGAGFEDLINKVDDVIAKAKALKVKYVMCAWIPHKGDVFTIEDTEKAIKVFNEAGKKLTEAGLTLCYHDHGYEFGPYKKGTLLDYLIQSTNPDYVSFEMDVFWTMHGGGANSPEKLLKKYPNRWKLMHVKDMKKGIIGDKTGHAPAEHDVPVGTGQANWAKIFKLAKKAGVKHYFIEDESNAELMNVPLSVAFLKSL